MRRAGPPQVASKASLYPALLCRRFPTRPLPELVKLARTHPFALFLCCVDSGAAADPAGQVGHDLVRRTLANQADRCRHFFAEVLALLSGERGRPWGGQLHIIVYITTRCASVGRGFQIRDSRFEAEGLPTLFIGG